jgi:hypothetical protein
MTGISTETAQRLLETALPGNDAKAPTVRGWLAALLRTAWIKREVFKRPFGWSGAWEDDIYRALIAAGIIAGELDEDGDLSRDFDYDAADQVILAAIEAMGVASGPGAPVSGEPVTPTPGQTARDPQAERDYAEWRGWLDGQGYDFDDDSYQAEAFTAGMEAERALTAAQEPPH